MDAYRQRYIHLRISLNSTVLAACLAASLTACGGGSSTAPIPEPPTPVPVEGIPTHVINHAYFRDQDGDTGSLAGKIQINAATELSESNKANSIWVYWADDLGNKIDNESYSAWLKTDSESVYDINIPTGTIIPANTSAFIIYPSNEKGLALKGSLIKFHDFIGNTQLSGPGGNYLYPWYYGQAPSSGTDVEGFPVTYTEQRDTLSIHRSEEGVCIFDNGLVSIIDMNYERDIDWEMGRNNGTNTQANQVDDILFPIYQYPCAESPVNTHRYIGDEEGAWLYSTINDAMFYGTMVYDTFVKYLGEPPIDDKLRIRVHYGAMNVPTGYWDGTYATFGDGLPFQLSASSLDSISHEVAHGVLNRLMGVDFFQADLSKGFRTLHEAFSDISGVMAWYEYVERTGEYTGETNYWRHGEENRGRERRLDQIVTEYGAIASMLDYDETEANNYLSIGMITYPFYLLQQQWGMEAAYNLYIDAARNCWAPTMNHTEIAQCLKQRAELLVSTANDPTIDMLPSNEKVDDVVAAFQVVKIKLFDEGVLSHYRVEKSKLRVQFTDDSRSTGQVTERLWDFGDGQTSSEENPLHTYATAGDYQVTLTVKNDAYVLNDDSTKYHKDDFTHTVSVSDQYCRITTGLDPKNDIGQVVMNGTDLNFQTDKSDYRGLAPIALIDPNNKTLNLHISGASNDTVDETIKWAVWLDINDDGFYSADEIVKTEVVAKGETYGWNTSIDLTAFIAAANIDVTEDHSEIARFIRVIGEHTFVDACSSAVGEAFDVRVAW